ncbi:hypothetical protein [Stakelama tenebrarum]|uniref:Lipoprotein n=1 Tax=Stakelama tenebrarum TaxID=2711215 RepID=A0A6G6Y1H9_9SPHN|nr:hypothetical protein [Sphingosinithalassobacter tenebrarum]QIG78794.1 hypothetical protein G5C33_02640 [Sphingosinithalassobacter tenebrarum]
MRLRLALLIPLLLLGACDLRFDADDAAMADRRMTRIVLPAPLIAEAPGDIAPQGLRTAYVHPRLGLALFFTREPGEGVPRYRAHFIDQKGLIDLSALMSSGALTRLDTGSAQALADDRRANMPLRVTGLPDQPFGVLPAQGGFLVEVRYGDLWFLSYGAITPQGLKLGNAIDADALAALAEEAGFATAMQRIPRLGYGATGAEPASLVRFSAVPPGLPRLIAEHAAEIYAPVVAGEDVWVVSPLSAPADLNDARGIEALRASLFAAIP